MPDPQNPQNPNQQLSLDEFEERVARSFGIPRGLREALKSQESGGNDKAVSYKGARGRFQVMPDTVKKYGNHLDPNDPFDQTYAGLRYLKEKFDSVDKNITDPGARWAAALAGYHGGERQIRNINRSGGQIASGSDGLTTTDKYVESIMSRWQRLSQQRSGQQPTQPAAAPVNPRAGLNRVDMRAGDTLDLTTGQIKRAGAQAPAKLRQLSRQRIKAQEDALYEWAKAQPTPPPNEQVIAARERLSAMPEAEFQQYLKGGGKPVPGKPFRRATLAEIAAEAARGSIPARKTPQEVAQDIQQEMLQEGREAARKANLGKVGRFVAGAGAPVFRAAAGVASAPERLRAALTGEDYNPLEAETALKIGALADVLQGAAEPTPEQSGILSAGGLGQLGGTVATALGPGRVAGRVVPGGGVIAAAGRGALGGGATMGALAAGEPASNTEVLTRAGAGAVSGGVGGAIGAGAARVAPAIPRAMGADPAGVAARAIPAATVVGGEAVGGALGNVTQAALEGRTDPETLKQEAALGAAMSLGLALPGARRGMRTLAPAADQSAQAALATPFLPEGVQIFRQGDASPPRQRGQRMIPIEIEQADGSVETVTVIAPERINGQRVSETTLRPMVENALRQEVRSQSTAGMVGQPKPQPSTQPRKAGDDVQVFRAGEAPEYDPATQKVVTFAGPNKETFIAVVPKNMSRQDAAAFGRQRIPQAPEPTASLTEPLTPDAQTIQRIQYPDAPETARVDQPAQPDAARRLIERTRQRAEELIGEGRFDEAVTELKAHQQALRDAKAKAGKKQPGLRVQLERQIGQAGNRIGQVRAMARQTQAGQRAGRSQQAAIENAPTADLAAPLLESKVNPEGGIPQAPESASGIFGQLARRQSAERQQPQRGRKPTGQLSAIEYLKRATGGEGVRVSDRGEARVLGAKEAGIVGLTNRNSKRRAIVQVIPERVFAPVREDYREALGESYSRAVQDIPLSEANAQLDKNLRDALDFFEEMKRTDFSSKRYWGTEDVTGKPSSPDDRRQAWESIGAEFRSRPGKREGTLLVNQQGMLAAESALRRVSATADDAAASGRSIKIATAERMAELLRRRAGDWGGKAGRNLDRLAAQIDEAIADAKAHGRNSIAIVDTTVEHPQYKPLEYAKMQRRHEAVHNWQWSINEKNQAILPDETITKDPDYRRLQAALSAYYENIQPNEVWAEAVAFTASGDYEAVGMTKHEAVAFLDRFFTNVENQHGQAALDSLRLIHPLAKGALENVRSRARQTDARGSGRRDGGLGRDGATQERDSLAVRAPKSGVAPRRQKGSGSGTGQPGSGEDLSLRERLGKKIGTAQAIAQLGNPRTIFQNLIGNAAFSGAKNVATAAALPMDRFLSLFSKQRQVATPELRTQMRDFVGGFADVWHAVKAGDYATLSGASKYDISNERAFKGKIGKFAQDVMDIALRGPDRGAYLAAYNDAVSQIQKGLAKSKKPFSLDQIHEQAKMEAQQAVFQDDNVVSKFTVGLKKVLNQISPFGEKANFGLADVIGLKYPRVPAGLVARAIEYSPAGFAKAFYKAGKVIAGKGKGFDQREASLAFGKAFVGSAFGAGMGALLCQMGVIVAPEKEDRGVATAERGEGLGGYQVNLSALKRYAMGGLFDGNTSAGKRQPGDILMTYDWLQPWAFALGMGAAASQAHQKSGGRKQALEDVLGQIDAATTTLTDQSILRNVRDAFRYGPGSAARRAAADTPASFVPAVLNQTRQIIDDRARELSREKGVKGMGREALDKVLNRLPVASKRLPERRDIVGRAALSRLEGAAGAALVPLPGKFSEYRPHPVLSEMQRLDTGSTGVRRRPGEAEGQFAARRSRAQDWLNTYGLQLVVSPAYKTASKPERQKAMEILRERIARQSGERKPKLDQFNSDSILRSAREMIHKGNRRAF